MTEPVVLSGPLGFLTAPALLRDLFVRRATGQLVAYHGDTVKKVFLKSGSILYATSNLEGDRLGDVLLAHGMITREQYEESASQVLATGRKQGTVLVQIGALNPKDLFRGLIAQVRELAISLFWWEEGNWRFLEGIPPQEEIVSLRLNPGPIIFEGLLRTSADPRWSEMWDLPRLQFAAAGAAPLTVDEIDAPDAVRRLIGLLDARRLPDELARLAGREPRETAALLYGLYLFGLVEATPRPAARAEAPAPAAPPQAPPAEDAETAKLRDKVLALAQKLPTLSHYQLLGLTPQSDADTIKRTYIALAKEYHPDRFFRPEFEGVQEAVNTIFMAVNEAYTTLHNPAARADYDRDVIKLGTPTARIKETPAGESHIAHEQFAKGTAALQAGDLFAAVQALRWAVNLSPQNPRYHTWLGVALLRTKKRLHEAEEHCKTAIALDYNNAQYYVHLGQVYRTGHLPDKARKQFETALKLDPKHAAALKELREMDGTAEKGLFDRIMKK
jgi:curved DNA-binding protein CbpA